MATNRSMSGGNMDTPTLSARSRQSLYKRLWPLVAGLMYYSGVVPLLRWRVRRSGRCMLILGYHRANANLRKHIHYLQRHYRIMPLEPALEELKRDNDNAPHHVVTRMPVVLTFDDGYLDNYTVAFALARQTNVPFTVFLIPGYIEQPSCFWWDEGADLVCRSHAKEAAVNGRTYHLDRPKERRALVSAIYTSMHDAPSVAERDARLMSIHQALGVPTDVPTAPRTSDNRATSLTWQEVREMESSGRVTFGAHTVHHPVLACLQDPMEVRREIGESKAILEQQLGHPVHAFAYPMGQVQDIGCLAVKAVREEGFKWSITTMPGFNTQYTDPCALHRIVTDTDVHWLVLAAQAVGVWDYLAPSRLLRALTRLCKGIVSPVVQWMPRSSIHHGLE